MKIEILGSGCSKCKALAANAAAAAEMAGIDCEIEKVTDIAKIVGYGVMLTPALVVDGKVVSVGRVLAPEEIAEKMKR